MISCMDLHDILLPVAGFQSCCTSCHDEADTFGESLCGGDGEHFSLCCRVSSFLTDVLKIDTLGPAPNWLLYLVEHNEPQD